MMDLRRLAIAVVTVTVTVTVVGEFGCCSLGNVVTFDVKHKFAGKARNLSALRAHDIRRHGRLLSTVDIDLHLGGIGHPAEVGLYFAQIRLGNPSKEYYVQVDTGSDILWVNCAGCDKCPTKSDLGLELTLYDPKKSSTSSLVYCDHDFCTSTYDGPLPGCKPDLQCQYNVVYGDGSSTAGYFVKDAIQLQQVTGNLQTGYTNGTVIFGCGAKQSGELGTSSEALDGILGFGQANSSMISQLAAAGNVKRMFAHCLDNISGGGIFAIGDIISPKVNTTPMVPNHVDDGFPVVKFHFEGSLVLVVYPHEYLFQIREDIWCFGWQNSGMESKDGSEMILLGDLVLSNKLVIYDIENQTIGWTEYDCSTNITVKDEKTGTVYSVSAHNIDSASSSLTIGGVVTFLSILIALLHMSSYIA
ncbi:hypothetical protein PTKIN_Ptkin06aG0117900 [Pterospermum kingtungense]